MSSSLVSVIVTTRNSSRTLSDCLESIQDQTYKNCETIVIDNHSEDKSLIIAHRFTDKVFTKGPERSTQRNFGVKKSRGMYLLFLDSDMYLNPSVLEQCVEKIGEENTEGVYIPEKMIGTSFWAKVRNFERSFYNMTPIDAVRFMKKPMFQKIGGFDENLVAGEDWDLDRRLRQKGNTAIIAAYVTHDEGNTSFGQLVEKKKGYSGYLQKYIDKWGIDDPIVQKQLGFTYRYFTVFTEHDKWTKIMRHPILTIAMYLLKAAQGWAYLMNRISA